MDRRSYMHYNLGERRYEEIPPTQDYPSFPTTPHQFGNSSSIHQQSHICNPNHNRHNNLRRTTSSSHPQTRRANKFYENFPQEHRNNLRTDHKLRQSEFVPQFSNNDQNLRSDHHLRQSEQFTNSNDPNVLVNLREKIMALQMQNIELNIYLKKEEEKRKEAEEAIRKERNYIRTLEENIETLNTTRVIMDPDLYKQVANDYIANHKKPVRRTRTCSPYLVGSSDLTCDSEKKRETAWKDSSGLFNGKNAEGKLRTKESHGSTSSCSTSGTDFQPSGSSSLPFNSPPYSRENSSDSSENYEPEWNIEASSSSSTPLNHEEYQELLKSLESLNTNSLTS